MPTVSSHEDSALSKRRVQEERQSHLDISPVSRAADGSGNFFTEKDDTHPVRTIQCHCDDIVVVSTDFVESGDYIFFNDCQLLASYIGINNGQNIYGGSLTRCTPND
jgi:hypothetical protein